MPPFGKLDASGSPWVSVFPENSVMAPPSPSGERKLSCFSARQARERIEDVRVVGGALPSAHAFIAAATTSATLGSSSDPVSIVFFTDRKISFGRSAFIVVRPKTLAPNSDAAALSL